MSYVQKFWNPIIGLATWITTSLAAFLNFQVHISSTSDVEHYVVGATVTLVALVCGFMTIVPRILPPSFGVLAWVRVGVVLFILFLVSVSIFVGLQLKWTCPYVEGIRLVVGDYVGVSCERHLREIAGLTDSIYSKSQLHARFLGIVVAYVGSWLFLAALVVTLSNATRTRLQSRRAKTQSRGN